MASLPSTVVNFSHATEPGVRITCYSVGVYGEKAGAPDMPILRCFVSSGAGTGSMAVPMGRYNSERGGLQIACESGETENRTCTVMRTGVTQEMPGPIGFLTDCATLMPDAVRCIGGEPIPAAPQTAITDARVSESAMLRDATGTPAGAFMASFASGSEARPSGTPAGAFMSGTSAQPGDSPQLTGTMTCMRTMVTRPVPITVFASGPASIAAAAEGRGV